MEELRREEKELKKKLEEVQDIIQKLQNLCPHEYPDGKSAIVSEHTYRYEWRECQICGWNEKIR